MYSNKPTIDLGQRSETTIWINARFLTRPVTGVERVAREMIGALARERLDDRGCWSEGDLSFRFKLIAPASSTVESPWANIALERRGSFSGHAWEQFSLPWITRGDMLVSLCNTGPVMKKRQIVFLHDAQPFAIPQNFSLQFRVWYKVMFNMLSRTSRAVLVNSRFTFSELNKHVKLNARKTFLCYLGCDHVLRESGNTKDLDRFDLPEEKFLLAVSSNNRNKNFSAVVQALGILGAAAPPCVIVGQSDQRHFEGSALDPEKVQHLGYISDSELIALYRRARCLVFPSFYEGFGLPPLEAMAVGCPTIVSNTSALAEVAGQLAEQCDPAKPATLARAIKRLDTAPDRCDWKTDMARSKARQFTWNKSCDCLLEALLFTHRSVDGNKRRFWVPALDHKDRLKVPENGPLLTDC